MAAHANEERKFAALFCFLAPSASKYAKQTWTRSAKGEQRLGGLSRGVSLSLAKNTMGEQCGPVRTSGRVTAADKREINRKSQFGGHSTRHSHFILGHGRGSGRGLSKGCVLLLCDLTIASLADLFAASWTAKN